MVFARKLKGLLLKNIQVKITKKYIVGLAKCGTLCTAVAPWD